MSEACSTLNWPAIVFFAGVFAFLVTVTVGYFIADTVQTKAYYKAMRMREALDDNAPKGEAHP